VVFGILTTLWSIATPLAASPDEPSHIMRAVSIDRGEWLGATVPGKNNAAYTRITVPSTYAQMGEIPQCYAFKPTVSASCIPKIKQSAKPTTVNDPAGRYSPLYYLIVGIPSIFTSGLIGVHLMRLVSALLSAAFIALAIATARRWSTSPWLSAAIVIAATPMSLFLGGTINPSGLEISSAIATWTAAVVLVTEHIDSPPRGLVVVLAASASVLALVRADTPLWLAVIAGVLAPMWYKRLRLGLLVRRLSTALSLGAVVIACGLAIGWTVYANALAVLPSPVPKHHTTWNAISVIVGATPGLLIQQIGVFGWLDTSSPWFTTTVWYFLGGAAIAIGAIASRARQLLTIALAVLAAIGIPVVFAVATYSHDGFYEQGRYFLAVSVGIPIVALGCARVRVAPRQARRLLLSLCGAIGAAQFLAFYYALRRYRVGTSGPMIGNGSLPTSQIWNPPLGTTSVEILFLLACVALVAVVGVSPKAEMPDGSILSWDHDLVPRAQ
jgi:hypothetical protein